MVTSAMPSCSHLYGVSELRLLSRKIGKLGVVGGGGPAGVVALGCFVDLGDACVLITITLVGSGVSVASPAGVSVTSGVSVASTFSVAVARGVNVGRGVREGVAVGSACAISGS